MLNKTCSLISILGALALSASPLIAAEPTHMQFGDVGHTNVEVKNIHHSGRLLLRKIKVIESTIVNGYLQVENSDLNQQTVVNGHIKAKDSKFNELTVNGDSDLTNDVVRGTTSINGKLDLDHTQFDASLTVFGHLKAKDSTFKKTVTVNNNNTDLENCNLEDITIQKGDGKQAQTLNLKATKVSGNVVFESGKGVVNMDSSSSVGGKVTGGTVNKK